jgi:DNA-binding IclR family transcriptional regulator
MLSRFDIRQRARPMMQEVADFARGVVALGVRVDLGIIYVATCRSAEALTLTLDVGSRLPLATTAMGRAYLASCPEEERQALVADLRAADKLRWAERKRGIDAALAEYRRLGCCSSIGDWQADVNGIAIGFDPGGGLPPMVVNCGGEAFNLPPAFLFEEVRPRLMSLVRRLQAEAAPE